MTAGLVMAIGACILLIFGLTESQRYERSVPDNHQRHHLAMMILYLLAGCMWMVGATLVWVLT